MAKSVDNWFSDLPCPVDAKRVVLLRHGQSTWNADGRIQGSSNHSVLTLKVRRKGGGEGDVAAWGSHLR